MDILSDKELVALIVSRAKKFDARCSTHIYTQPQTSKALLSGVLSPLEILKGRVNKSLKANGKKYKKKVLKKDLL